MLMFCFVAGAAGQHLIRDRWRMAPELVSPKDGRFVQLGDNGKLLVQGTEVEVEGVGQPRKRAVGQVM